MMVHDKTYIETHSKDFIRVGFNNLNRNDVFYDVKNNIYIKFYKNRTHFTNEKYALQFYENEPCVPSLLASTDMCILSEALKGTELEETDLSEKEYILMGDFLRNFHKKHMITFNKNCILSSDNAADYYAIEQQRIDKTVKRLEYSEYFKSYRILLTDLLDELDFKTMGFQCTLCHNDFCNRNVLFDNGKITGIIDFEKSFFADPICDLSTIIVKELHSTKLEVFIRSYFGGNATLIDKKKMIYFSILKALEIVSWARSRDERYYLKAETLLKDWNMLYDII